MYFTGWPSKIIIFGSLLWLTFSSFTNVTSLPGLTWLLGRVVPIGWVSAPLTTWLFFTELIMSEGHLNQVSHSLLLVVTLQSSQNTKYFCSSQILLSLIPRLSSPLSRGRCIQSWPSFMTTSRGWGRPRPSSSMRSSTATPGPTSPTPPPDRSATATRTSRTTTSGTTETTAFISSLYVS